MTQDSTFDIPIVMRAFTTIASFFCTAALFLSAGAEPIRARQIIVPPNERIYDGPLVKYEGDGSNACGGLIPALVEVVAINPTVWEQGDHCHGSVSITYNGQSYSAIIIDECADCPEDGIGLFHAFYEQVVGDSNGPSVEGSWNLVF